MIQGPRTFLLQALLWTLTVQEASSNLVLRDLRGESLAEEKGSPGPQDTGKTSNIRLEILVSVPKFQQGQTVIVSSPIEMGQYRLQMPIKAKKNETYCEKAPATHSCTASGPELSVSVQAVVSGVDRHVYSANVTSKHLQLTVHINGGVSVTPTFTDGTKNTTEVLIRVMVDSFQNLHKDGNSSEVSLILETSNTKTPTAPSPTAQPSHSSGPSTLCCGARKNLILLLLLPALLLH